MKRLATAGIALVLCLSASACSLNGTTHQSSQAGATDHSAAQVLQMPSGFRNVAAKCVIIGGSAYAVASVSDGGNSDNKDGAVAIAPDPTCHHNGP